MEEYILYHDIGRGNTAAVFKGRKSNTLEYLALLQVEQKYSQLAAVRYAAAQAVASEHVCRVDLHCDTGPEVWLVAELCSGISMRTVLNGDGYLMGTHLTQVMSEMLLAVAHCHAAGLVIGDVRLEKFLVQDGHVKLCSLARAMATRPLGAVPTTPSPTDAKEVSVPLADKQHVRSLIADMDRIHCQQYLAPEVLTRHTATPLSDLWAAGIAMLELMIGRAVPPPEAGAELHADNLRDVAREIGHSSELADLVLNLLQRKLEKRWCWRDVLHSPLFHDDPRFVALQEQLAEVDAAFAPVAVARPQGGPRLSASVTSRVSSTASSRSTSSSAATVVGPEGSSSGGGGRSTEPGVGEFDAADNDEDEEQQERQEREQQLQRVAGALGEEASTSVAAVFKDEDDTLMATRQLNPATSLILSKASATRRTLQPHQQQQQQQQQRPRTGPPVNSKGSAQQRDIIDSGGGDVADAPRARTAQAWLEPEAGTGEHANPWAKRSRAEEALRRAQALLQRHGQEGQADENEDEDGDDGDEEGAEFRAGLKEREAPHTMVREHDMASARTPQQQQQHKRNFRTEVGAMSPKPLAAQRSEVTDQSDTQSDSLLADSHAASGRVAGRGTDRGSPEGPEEANGDEAERIGGRELRNSAARNFPQGNAAGGEEGDLHSRPSPQRQFEAKPAPKAEAAERAPFRASTLDRSAVKRAAAACTPAGLRALVHEFDASESPSAPKAKHPRKQGLLWELLAEDKLPLVDELILIDSDLTVAPILNTKNKFPKYDPHAVSGYHYTAEEIAEMTEEEVKRFTDRLMSALQLVPATRSRSRATVKQQRSPASSARPEKRTRLHVLGYLLHISQHEEVCNVLANSPVLPALCAGFRAAPDFCRERMAVLIGTIIRNTTLMYEDVDMALMLHNLADALREFFRYTSLKRLIASAVGEALFYTVTQRLAATTDLPSTWSIPPVALKMVFKCLNREEDKAVQLAAARSLENMASVDGAHQETLRRPDVMLMLWRVLFHANTGSLRRACAATMLHITYTDSSLFQHVLDNAGAANVVDLFQDGTPRVTQAVLSCCLVLFSEAQPQRRGQMLLADVETIVPSLIRCIQQRQSADVMAKAYLLLAGLQRVKPQALERICSPSALGARPHGPFDSLLTNLDHIHIVHVVKEQSSEESLEYLQQCSASLVGIACDWVSTLVDHLHSLMELVSRRRHPSGQQSKELREACDLFKLAVAYLHSTVMLQALPSSQLYISCLRLLRCVAFVLDGTTSLDDVGEDAGQALFTETAVALLQLTHHADAQPLLEAWAEMIHGVGAFRAVQDQEIKQTVLQVYTAASQHVHANVDWAYTRQVLQTSSPDLQDLLTLVVQVFESETTSSVPCFHVLCDLWNAFPARMASFCTTMPEIVEESLTTFQPLVDMMSPADLVSQQMCETAHDLDSPFVLRHALYVVASLPELDDTELAIHFVSSGRLISKAVGALVASVLAVGKEELRAAEDADVAMFALQSSMASLILLLDFVLHHKKLCSELLRFFSPVSIMVPRIVTAVPKQMLPKLRPINEFVQVFSSPLPPDEREGFLSLVSDAA